MLDFRVVIAACIAGVVILLGGIGLLASFRIAQEPARPASRIVERPRIESNASLPVVVETPATNLAPVVLATPAPAPESQPVEISVPAQAQPPPAEITGTIAPAEPVEPPHATVGLPPSSVTAKKKTPRRPRPAVPAPAPPGPTNPFSALFGGFRNQ